MKKPNVKPVVRLSGRDGNAFAILGRVKTALQRSGSDAEYISKFISEATSGNYDNLLQTCMKYVTIE